MLPIPVDRYLVPSSPGDPPPDAQLVDIPLETGLPAQISLGPDVSLVATLATGLATEWRAADPTDPVAGSANEWEALVPTTASVGDVSTARLTLLLQRSGQTIAAVPLVSGRCMLEEACAPSA